MPNKTLLSNYRLFEHAPISTAILNAENLKLEMINEKMLELWGRPSSIINTPLLDFLPELAEQAYPELITQVVKSGKPWEEQGASVLLNRYGKMDHVYVDYSYTPIFNDKDTVTAILVMATDISKLELSKLMVNQYERNLRALVMSAPVPMCIYKGEGLRLEVVNTLMLELWQDRHSMYLPALQHVYHNGLPYSFTEKGLRYSCTPLADGISGVSGVCVIATKIVS